MLATQQTQEGSRKTASCSYKETSDANKATRAVFLHSKDVEDVGISRSMIVERGSTDE